MFLTHRDDVADHDAWARRFAAERILHRADAAHLQDRIERLLEGSNPVSIAPDLLLIPTPGHTRGHTVLLYRNHFLFSGDHLWWSEHYRGLHASRSVNWYSWPEQVRSVRLLLDYSFEWVLPGHGRRAHAPAAEMRRLLQECLNRIA
jgi:glyoxylase-like metal-dependent hydrolase (beta-lactamase superfamily II)